MQFRPFRLDLYSAYSSALARGLRLVVPVLALILTGRASGGATEQQQGVGCLSGQFLLDPPLAIGSPGAERLGHALTFADGMAAIPGVCRPTAFVLRPDRRSSRLAATWEGCAGVPGQFRLEGTTDATCTEITGRFYLPEQLHHGPINVKAPRDTCFFDPGPAPLEETGSDVTSIACTSTIDDIAKILDGVCTALQGGAPCPSSPPICSQRTQELFSGVTLFPSTVQPPAWNRFGGRGEIMGKAGLCMMKDLAKSAHTNTAKAAFAGLGVDVDQRVGFLRFDRAKQLVEAYQDLDLCVPIFGCLSGVGQHLVVQLRESCPAHPLGRSCGTYPIRAAWALDVTTPEVVRYLPLVAPAITVMTPYGPVKVTPEIEFREHLTGIVSPYGSSSASKETLAPLDFEAVGGPIPPRTATLHDLYGRAAGVVASATLGDLFDSGWDSQLGPGSRDARAGTNVWSPGNDSQRPDHDLGVARSDAENQATFEVTASADVRYSPTDLLPAALRGSAVSLSFEIYVTPRLDARAAGQLAFYLSEGWSSPLADVPHAMEHTQLYVRDGAEAGGSLVILAGLNLQAWIDLGFPIGKIWLADIHKNLSVPLDSACRNSEGQDCGSATKWRNAHAASDTAPPQPPKFTGPIRTFHGDVDGPPFLAECLSQDVLEQTAPTPSFLPSSITGLVEDLPQPCNVCVSVQGHQVHQCAPNEGHTPAECPTGPGGNCSPGVAPGACHEVDFDSSATAKSILPSDANPLPPDKQWHCNILTAGCLDLCILDGAGHWVVSKSAVDLVGSQCRLDIPR
jgi:hypothetical protein